MKSMVFKVWRFCIKGKQLFSVKMLQHVLCYSQGLLQELRLLKSKVDVLEGEKLQYERKLKATKVKNKIKFKKMFIHMAL